MLYSIMPFEPFLPRCDSEACGSSSTSAYHVEVRCPEGLMSPKTASQMA